jgi:hypothetical protein
MKGYDLTKGHDHSTNMTNQCVYIYHDGGHCISYHSVNLYMYNCSSCIFVYYSSYVGYKNDEAHGLIGMPIFSDLQFHL